MIINRYEKVNKQTAIVRVLVIVLVLVVLGLSTKMTISWLSTQSQLISNQFESSIVTCNVIEDFSNGVKSDVCIKNTGSMHSYIRAAVTPMFLDGNDVVARTVSLQNCNIDFGSAFGTTWMLGSDGYYYCTEPIAPNEYTPILIDECTVILDDEYSFELQITAQAIQAVPSFVVLEVWDSAVSGVNAEGKLEVVQ